MRQIKFRAWDEKRNEMLPWKGVQHMVMYTLDGEDIGKEPNPYTFMQYTGLKDKNGKEIYEGDILSYKRAKKPMIARVIWSKHHAQFEADNKEHFSLYGLLFSAECGVVGNIYESSELLEDR